MLAFFPEPYPDELLYSVCARYHQRSGNQDFRATARDLFGAPLGCAVADLPSRLDHLVRQLPAGSSISSDRLIRENTLLPLYWSFLPEDRVNKLVSWMKSADRGPSIHLAAGVMASGVPMPKYLRICPECLAEDERLYGEPYWHRSHQAAGGLVCSRHEAWLRDSGVSAASAQNRQTFVTAPGPTVENHAWADDRHFLFCSDIARAVAWLLGRPKPDESLRLESLRERYRDHLRLSGLADYSGRVSQQALLERFVAHYGIDFLRQVGCAVDPGSQDNWLNTLVRKPRRACHPLRHLLLIRFLDVGIEEFFDGRIPETLPFGKGPWPCLNAAASHYRQAVVGRCVVTRNPETGAPIGHFYCPCGFAYVRSGPDRLDDDRFRRGKIIDVGPMWKEKLVRLMETEGMSLRAAARVLGVHVNTVTRHLEDLANTDVSEEMDSSRRATRDERRSRWLVLRSSFPEKGRKVLRDLAPTDYFWLYRYDRAWLFDNLPPAQGQSRRSKGRVDWPRRDHELARRILPAAQAIRSASGRPIRVTVGSLGKRLGAQAFLQKQIGKFPETRACLEVVIESREAFAIRRIRWAAEELLERGEPLAPWRILREARLRPMRSKKLAEEIHHLISST